MIRLIKLLAICLILTTSLFAQTEVNDLFVIDDLTEAQITALTDADQRVMYIAADTDKAFTAKSDGTTMALGSSMPTANSVNSYRIVQDLTERDALTAVTDDIVFVRDLGQLFEATSPTTWLGVSGANGYSAGASQVFANPTNVLPDDEHTRINVVVSSQTNINIGDGAWPVRATALFKIDNSANGSSVTLNWNAAYKSRLGTNLGSTTVPAGAVRYYAFESDGSNNYSLTYNRDESILAQVPLAEGVEVQAAPPQTSTILVTAATTPTQEILTGVNLNEVDYLYFSITNGDTGQETRKIDLSTFVYDNNQGGLLHWWDAVGIRLRINTADKPTGRLLVAYLTSGSLRINKIEFKKRIDAISPVQELAITNATLTNGTWATNPLSIGDLTSPSLLGSYLMIRWEAGGEQHWQRFELPFDADVIQAGHTHRDGVSWTVRGRVANTALDVLELRQGTFGATGGGSQLTGIKLYTLVGSN